MSDDDNTVTLDGPPDPWDHDSWVAAWGRNSPLVLSPNDFRIPNPPMGMSWLLTRMLVKGQKVIDMALVRVGEDETTTVARGRVVPEQDAVADLASRIVQESLG